MARCCSLHVVPRPRCLLTVNSWEGGCSQVDSDIAKERKAERKRRWSDGYEEELDMGKVGVDVDKGAYKRPMSYVSFPFVLNSTTTKMYFF